MEQSDFTRSTVFKGLTQPQMFAGVTYNFFIFNMIVFAELFLIFKSWWPFLIAIILHIVGVILCLRDPNIFEIWITRVSKCPRVKNYRLWGCNSYRP